MGSKSRISKYIIPIIQQRIKDYNIKTYIEPFCGGCNVIDKVQCDTKIAFSSKNLPKIEYLIPKDELREYEDIIAPLKEDGKLLALSKLTQNYIKLLSKKRLYRGVDMKTYMRKKMLKGKEFIHSEGHWNDYLKYLRKEIPNA